jgi:ferredoxin
MGRPAWQIKMITAFWPGRRALARMVNWPVFRRWLRLAFQGDQIAYIPVRVDLETPQSIPLPSPLVERFIRGSSFCFVLHQCICRTLESCRKYPPEIGCLFLGEGAKEIDSSLGREVNVEEALAHHRRAVALGLIPMVGKLRWDTIWLGVKQGDRLISICHCCDCCCYFKLYRFLPSEVAQSLQKLEGLEIQVTEACNGCGICTERCFIGAIKIQKGVAVISEECRGCGRCASVCPRQAIKVFLRSEKAIEEYLRKLRPAQEFTTQNS